MRFTCEQQHLLRGVQTVGRAISTRTTMPVLNNIFLETTRDGIKLSATDLEVSIQMVVLGAVHEGGAVTLPGRLLGEVVANLPEGDVEITVEEGAAQAIVTCGGTVVELLGLPATDFPLAPEVDAEQLITIDAGLLRGMIRQTAFAVSADETRPFLTGIYLLAEAKELKMVATDGGRLALRSADLHSAARQKLGVIVPAKAMQEVARAIGGASGDVSVALAENQLVYAVGDVRVASRLIAGQFPNYQQVIPQSYKQRLRLESERFLRAVRRAAVTARDSANVVRISATDSELTVASNTPEVGKTVEKIPVDAEGETIQVAFNARYLMDCLTVLETNELTFELTGPLTPGAIRPVGQADYVYVLAPVRVYA